MHTYIIYLIPFIIYYLINCNVVFWYGTEKCLFATFFPSHCICALIVWHVDARGGKITHFLAIFRWQLEWHRHRHHQLHTFAQCHIECKLKSTRYRYIFLNKFLSFILMWVRLPFIIFWYFRNLRQTLEKNQNDKLSWQLVYCFCSFAKQFPYSIRMLNFTRRQIVLSLQRNDSLSCLVRHSIRSNQMEFQLKIANCWSVSFCSKMFRLFVNYPISFYAAGSIGKFNINFKSIK